MSTKSLPAAEHSKNRRNPWLLLFVLLIISAAAYFLTSGGGDDSQLSYRVTNETGLYPASGDNLLARLATGTVVVPANGATSLNCQNRTVESVSVELCHIEVQPGGGDGWVLRKWMEQQ